MCSAKNQSPNVSQTRILYFFKGNSVHFNLNNSNSKKSYKQECLFLYVAHVF